MNAWSFKTMPKLKAKVDCLYLLLFSIFALLIFSRLSFITNLLIKCLNLHWKYWIILLFEQLIWMWHEEGILDVLFLRNILQQKGVTLRISELTIIVVIDLLMEWNYFMNSCNHFLELLYNIVKLNQNINNIAIKSY